MKKIVFLTGTRADFGKQKSLIGILSNAKDFKVYIFVTGIHLNPKYGTTVNEIIKSGFTNITTFINHHDYDSMDQILAKTIMGFSEFVKKINPDLIIVHGDRVETLAGAIVGTLNNILVGHIEGGEVSGTIDELIRHAVSKLAHVHFVANEWAKKRLIQMGEESYNIYIIGSPDIDVMISDSLPHIDQVKRHYNIPFKTFALLVFHPVTTEVDQTEKQANNLVEAVIESVFNYIVVYPNNDLGTNYIFKAYEKLKSVDRVKIYPSIRFEYFLVLLKHAKFILGNSSLGIREAPFYQIPTVNIGTRQKGRALSKNIINCDYSKEEILAAIKNVKNVRVAKSIHYGKGNSAKMFIEILRNLNLWKVKKQKIFNDLD